MKSARPPLFSVLATCFRWRVVLGTAVWGLTHSALPAAAPDYYARMWTTEDGLPHNSVSRVVQDAQGYLWFATLGGLASFDGRAFREYRPPDRFHPVGFNIRALAEERPGTMVVVISGGRVLRLENGEWRDHPIVGTTNWPADGVTDFHVGRDGAVWVPQTNAMWRWDPHGGLRTVDVPDGLDVPGRRRTFATDLAGNLWVGARQLLMIRADGSEARSRLTSGPCLVGSGASGRVWVCSPGELLVVENGALKTVGRGMPWDRQLAELRAVYESRRGDVWIASTRHGLLRFRDGRIEHVDTPFRSVTHVSEDREGNIWLATEGSGAGQLREKPYQLYTQADGLRAEAVSAVCADAQDCVWLANRTGGLAMISPGGRTAEPMLDVFANVVASDHAGAIWVGGGLDGLRRWQPGAREADVVPVPDANPYIVHCARNGDVWFAGSHGSLGYYRNGTPRVLTAADGYTSLDVRAIADDPQGQVWIGSREGVLLRWDGARVTSVTPAGSGRVAPIHAVFADRSGIVWIGTAGGLLVKQNAQLDLVTEADGLADDILQQVIEDDLGRLWFGSRRGIFFVTKSDVLQFVGRRVGRITSHLLGRNYGLSGVSPTANYQPGAAKTSDGRLWFAMSQGAVAVDPAKLPHDLPPAPIVIDEARLDDRPVELGPEPLRFASGQHRIEFHFSVLSFTVPENIVVRHCLQGIDRSWVDTGAERTAAYTNLNPGEYRLRVIARNSAGEWNTDGATLAFTVVPAWWERWSFRAIAILAVIVGTALLGRAFAHRRLAARLQRLEQEQALTRERARIARDLHDDLGSSLTEVGLVADRLVGSAPPSLSAELSGLAWRSRRLAAELSSIVWTMNPQNVSLAEFAEYLSRYADRLFRAAPTRCHVKGTETIPDVPLTPDLQHHLLAVAREALNNVLKHSAAARVVVTTAYADGVFELRIADDGVGFDSNRHATSADGNGLRNIRQRMEEAGGTVVIQSRPGGGTELAVTVHVGGTSARDGAPVR